VVDEDALYLALKEGRLAGAGLEVLTKHPPDPGNPLLKLDNAIFTPHCAGLTIDASRSLSNFCVKAIMDLFMGKIPEPPVNMLNPQVAETYVRAKRPA
jgi:D-3-phosphoglycerate dehydrogenase